MTDAHLDEVYTALAQAVARAGEDQAPLLLSMLSLQLLSQLPDKDSALASIHRAESGLQN